MDEEFGELISLEPLGEFSIITVCPHCNFREQTDCMYSDIEDDGSASIVEIPCSNNDCYEWYKVKIG